MDMPATLPRHATITEVGRASLPTRFGSFQSVVFRDQDGKEHVALLRGDVRGQENVMMRVHSECMTGDVFTSLRCDCRAQLELALERLAAQTCGMLLYLRQEGRGIGLGNKMRAYALQEQGLDTVDANLALGFADDERDYTVAAQMLQQLGVGSVQLLTNNPDKVAQLRRHGVRVGTRIPHITPPNGHNDAYLRTKAERSGHMLPHGACTQEGTCHASV